MAHTARKAWITVTVIAVCASAAVIAAFSLTPHSTVESRQERQTRPVPVEVQAASRDLIEEKRVFSGSLQAAYRLNIAPKISGQLATLAVDLADPVANGQIVATLDKDESEQLVAQSEAELAVAQASLTQSQSAAEIARREYERVAELHEQRIVSDSEYDAARAERLAAEAAEAVARAQVARAEAALESARIRLSYTTIAARWTQGDDRRVVAERLAEEGDAVSEGEPILTIVELDPIEAVFFAAETEYARLSPGQPVEITTDAYPDRTWTGSVARVAPVFREGSRQARVEVEIPNPEGALKPGMFARITTVLRRASDAVVIPRAAITKRSGQDVVFVVSGDRVKLRPVELGLQTPERVQALNIAPGERVVTLGQQLLEDGAPVTIPETSTPDAP